MTRWPQPPEDWADTRATFQLWTQVVGKVRLARTPLSNHWWNVPLYVTARGLTTSLMSHPTGGAFQIDFDLVDHELVVSTPDRVHRRPLRPESVADFYRAVMDLLDDLGVGTEIWPMPVEIEGAIPFDKDDLHSSYDAAQISLFWSTLVEAQRVFEVFRGRFVGKVSPVHFFWGGIDLAVTRFSGRTAPPHPGGAPNCGPHVMREAYSHEVSSAGFWPGPDGRGAFYSYAYPEPAGYRDAPVAPAEAGFAPELGDFLLPYDAVHRAADPDAMVLEFLQSTYVAAAESAHWDRDSLERPAGR
jgi:hypothetical protein